MFESRVDAGYLLADKLKKFKSKKDAIIVGIPRGGVVVADIVAKELELPLTTTIVRKIGAPDNSELALGAVAEENTVFWDKDILSSYSLNEQDLDKLLKVKRTEVEKRREMFGPAIDVKDKTVIIVDDGVATGSTVIAGSMSLKKQGAIKTILATPVIAKDTLNSISRYFDDVLVVDRTPKLYAIGEFYKEFEQVEDQKVIDILQQAVI